MSDYAQLGWLAIGAIIGWLVAYLAYKPESRDVRRH